MTTGLRSATALSTGSLAGLGEGPPAPAGAASPEGWEQQWEDDRFVLSWLHEQAAYLDRSVGALRADRVSQQVLRMGLDDPQAVVEGVLQLLRASSALPAADADAAVQALRRGLLFGPSAGARADAKR